MHSTENVPVKAENHTLMAARKFCFNFKFFLTFSPFHIARLPHPLTHRFLLPTISPAVTFPAHLFLLSLIRVHTHHIYDSLFCFWPVHSSCLFGFCSRFSVTWTFICPPASVPACLPVFLSVPDCKLHHQIND